MKTTKLLRALFALAFMTVLCTNFGCAAFLDAELGIKPIPEKPDGTIDFDKVEELIREDFRNTIDDSRFYPNSFLDTAVGFGLASGDNNTDISYCIGAGYNYRISEDNYNGASYIRGFAIQSWQNGDDRESSITRVGIGYNYFDRIDKAGDLDLTYGVDLNYGFGNVESFNVEEDYSEIGATLKLGANYEVSDKFDIGVSIPIASWSQQKFEAGGVEFEQDRTWIGLNRDNTIMAYGRIKLD